MSTFPGAPSGASALEDPNANPLNYGIPQTSQGQQFLLEEQAAGAARGGSSPFTGWTLPPGMAGDFWALYQMAEQFGAVSGWRNLPTPQLLTSLLSQGAATWDQTQVFAAFAQGMNVDTQQMPWVLSGMARTDWEKAAQSINATIYELTGQESWSTLGLPASMLQTALTQGWSAATISDAIQKTPGLNATYGYLKYGYNYNTFQNYKSQNKQALESRYGVGYTDSQAIQNLGSPLPTFHASGGAFGQSTPYVQSQSNLPTGYAASGR